MHICNDRFRGIAAIRVRSGNNKIPRDRLPGLFIHFCGDPGSSTRDAKVNLTLAHIVIRGRRNGVSTHGGARKLYVAVYFPRRVCGSTV